MIITSFVSGDRKTWCVTSPNFKYEDIIKFLHIKEGPANDIVLFLNNNVLQQDVAVSNDASITAKLRLRGGKGGFGSMLRAIGAQIEKTTNREACRDLSGRRLRDINEEKRLKEHLAKKVEKENEALERKRKNLEQFKNGYKHTFEDNSYFEQCEKREKDLYDSLDKAFSNKGEASGVKRCSETDKKVSKKARMFDDLDEESSEESDIDESLTKQVKMTEETLENAIEGAKAAI